MKNIKSKIKLLAITISVLFLVFILIVEFYTWKSHGYKSDYSLRQKCIEVSELTPEEEKACKEFSAQ